MRALRHTVLSLLLVLASTASQAANEPMVFIAATNMSMPLAQFTDGQLSGGILKDLGTAIAQQLGRSVRFVTMPSKRVAIALRNNEADAVCYVLPQWIDGTFHWSRPLLPNAALIIANLDAPPIRTLKDLAGTKIGTVSGYRYPLLDDLLGKQFLRDDAPTMEHVFSKQAAGRTRYAIVGQKMLDYRRRTDKQFKVRVDQVLANVMAQCALGSGSQIVPAEFDKAIDSLVEAGTVQRILSNYR